MAKASKKPSSRPSPASGRGRLKVFRTPIGFHDAYVAAPSQKAALEAWGADANIFAQGIAEQVEPDSKAAKEALERPGEVIRTLRGSADEHVKALGKTGARKAKKAASSPSRQAAPARARGKKPSRAALDEAEAALEKRERKHREALRKLDDEAEDLRRRRRELERDHQRERQAMKEAVRDEEARYERAMEVWKA